MYAVAESEFVERKAKGANFGSLVRALRSHRKRKPLGPMPASAEAMLETRFLDHAWYPHQPLVDLLRVLYRDVLGSSDEQTLQVGILEGKNALQTLHSMFVMQNDPIGSALAMRHSWRTYFNFGDLKAEQTSPTDVTLTLSGYHDVQPVHANMILGWAIAAAQLGGAASATGELLERPWTGKSKILVYRVKI
jgi:hypothetical protein